MVYLILLLIGANSNVEKVERDYHMDVILTYFFSPKCEGGFLSEKLIQKYVTALVSSA